ncbi:MAG: hypothetical protein E7377_02765 [Clostridiales bacterium]|nr:hypothetical protein [Clostridiales bacterium]
MLDYTIAAFNKTKEDFKKATWIGTCAMQIFYIIYLVYALITKAGYLWANIILLALSVGYFAFFLVMKFHELKKGFKKLGKRIYKYSKLAVNTLTLGGTILTLATSEMTEIQPLSLVLLTLTIITWVLQAVLELATPILEKRLDFMITALQADWENIIKPFRATGNFFKKIVGKEVEEEAAPTKTRQLLDKLVEERREKKAQEKLDKKLQKKALKAERKAEKKAAKQEQKPILTQEEDNE